MNKNMGRGFLKSFSVSLSLFLATIIFSAYPFSANAVSPSIIFEDGFENLPKFTDPVWYADPQWSTSSNFAKYGSKKAFIQGNTNVPNHTNNDYLKRTESTLGFENITISYWYKTDGGLEQNDNDKVDVEWTANGTDWNTLFTINHTNDVEIWTEKVHQILSPSANNNPDFAIRFIAKLDSGNDKFYLDAVKITGTPISQDSQNATVVANKVICDSEAYLPNWGDGEPEFTITANTASDFVNQSDSKCRLVDNWKFEWAPSTAINPGDNEISGQNNWTEFVNSVELAPANRIWFREKMNSDYMEFSGDISPQDGFNDISAEFYCNNDVLNYDNYEWINNLEAGKTYYCVAFNVLKKQPPVCDPEVNLIKNGNFESPVVENSAKWDIFASGSENLEWNVDWLGGPLSFQETDRPETANLELHRGVNGWLTASETNNLQYAELDTDWFGPESSLNNEPASVAIWQNIETIPDKTYKLSFNFSPRPDTTNTENVLGVYWGGAVATSSISETGGSATFWKNYVINLTATTTSTNIMFRDEGEANSLGTFLDDVSLYCQNSNTNPNEKEKIQVKIYKYIDGVQANSLLTNEYSFPMQSSWSFDGSSGSGVYTLGPSGYNSPDPYSAFTSEMYVPAIYNTNEVTTIIDETSKVLPIGSECSKNMYRLKGYRVGNSLESAEESDLQTSDVSLTNLSENTYVIVENEKCPSDDGDDENNDNQIIQNDEASQIPGGRRRDISSLISGGEVLGASTEEQNYVCEPYLKSYIKFGANNDPEDVKRLQIFLNQFFEVDNPVTGFYGDITYQMVKKFQAHQKDGTLTPWSVAGLPTDGPTGYVYKTTKRWINILKCPEMIENTPIPELP